jgi:hypothetical protein
MTIGALIIMIVFFAELALCMIWTEKSFYLNILSGNFWRKKRKK